MDFIIGTVLLMAINFCPMGFLPCDGRLVPIQGYEVLYSLIGTQYGGDGVTTFALPDFRGRIPVGNPINPIKGGTSTNTISLSNFPAHSHTVNSSINVSKDAATGSVPSAGNYVSSGKSDAPRQPELYRADAPAGTATINTASAVSTVGVISGSGLPTNNMQPYIGLQYIICTEGTYPQQM